MTPTVGAHSHIPNPDSRSHATLQHCSTVHTQFIPVSHLMSDDKMTIATMPMTAVDAGALACAWRSAQPRIHPHLVTKANLHAVNTNRFNAQPPSYSPLSPRTHGTHQHSGPPHRTSPADPPDHPPWSATPPQTAPPRYPTQQHYRRTNEPTSSVSERTSERATERAVSLANSTESSRGSIPARNTRTTETTPSQPLRPLPSHTNQIIHPNTPTRPSKRDESRGKSRIR